jgi:hypothetical protein
MKLTDKQQRFIDIIQWVLIGFLMLLCFVVFIGNKNLKRERDIQREDTYIKIYESQKISELEKKSKALYDSLMKKSDKEPESAIEIRYKYKYKTDTIKVTEFVVSDDSIYHYSHDNDTVKTNIDIKAKDLDWCKVDAQINDKFTIINRTDGNENETTINHSSNVEITGVDAWHRKRTFKDRLMFGPTVSIGYNPFTKKGEFLIGVSVGIDLKKKK